jgi:hypothetical protein
MAESYLAFQEEKCNIGITPPAVVIRRRRRTR